jgi:hypothetical protein
MDESLLESNPMRDSAETKIGAIHYLLEHTVFDGKAIKKRIGFLKKGLVFW